MKKLILISMLALSVGGCAQLTNAYNALTGVSVSPTAVIVAANAFDGLEATATNYLKLPKCGSFPCRNQNAVMAIIPAIRSGRIARNNLEQFLAANPGALGPQGLYNALTAATDTLKQVFLQYGIN